MLNHIPEMISAQQNAIFLELLEQDEFRTAVSGPSAESTGGPDGYTGKFLSSLLGYNC